MRNIDYVGAFYDQIEIDAVVEVLRTSLRVGENVARLEAEVAALWAKQRGVMVNSGSSALQLAYDVMDLPPGSEFITSAVTFSTTVAPGIRNGLVPVVVDVDLDSYQIEVDAIEGAVSDRTRAVVVPNLAGNCPDWDRIRSVADAHDLVVVEDSADTMGATLHGTPTGLRSDISVTSFAMSHIITAAGNGGMVMTDRDDWWDRALLRRRWGRSSEPRFFGTRQDERGRFVAEVDGLAYDALFVFEELGHNFEPSEMGAAFALVQLERMPGFLERRQANVAAYTSFFGQWPEAFRTPVETPGLVTSWLQYPLQIEPTAPFDRADFQAHMKAYGIATRMVWSGNVTRQPMWDGVRHRVAPGGLANADRIMERGVLLPCHQTMDAEDLDYVRSAVRDLLDHGPRSRGGRS